MAQQTINIGAIANDNTGDTLRGAGQKINDNFDEIYASLPLVAPATWVPTLTDSGGGRTFAFTVNTARHTSIGFVTTFTADLTINSVTGSATGELRLGLPDASTYDAAVSIWLDNATTQAKTAVIGKVVGGTSYCQLSHYETGDISSLASQLQATSRILVSGVYFTC
ncbi:MAG: hypothetical protein ACO3BH_14905 [Quisquiliibacterium sp.]